MEIRKFLVFAPFLMVGCNSGADLPKPPPSCPDQAGIICTWAGSTEGGGWNGDDNPINQTKLNTPTDVAFDRDYNPYVIDRENHRIRKVKDGKFTTVLGTGNVGDGDQNGADETDTGAPGASVAVHSPTNMTLSAFFGFVTDWKNHKLRRIDLTTTSTRLWGGTSQWKMGANGDGGPVSSAMFSYPSRMAFLANPGEFFVIDQKAQTIRMIMQDGSYVSTIAGTFDKDGKAQAGYDEGGLYNAPGLAKFHFDDGGTNPAQIQPSGGLVVDAGGSLYIADSLNNVIRKISFNIYQGRSQPKTIETIAGDAAGRKPGFVDGDARSARFNNPTDMEITGEGVIYITDTGNNAIRRFDPITNKVETVVGKGTAGFSGDGGAATEAELNKPLGIAFDQNQVHLYIADTNNHRIRRVRLY